MSRHGDDLDSQHGLPPIDRGPAIPDEDFDEQDFDGQEFGEEDSVPLDKDEGTSDDERPPYTLEEGIPWLKERLANLPDDLAERVVFHILVYTSRMVPEPPKPLLELSVKDIRGLDVDKIANLEELRILQGMISRAKNKIISMLDEHLKHEDNIQNLLKCLGISVGGLGDIKPQKRWSWLSKHSIICGWEGNIVNYLVDTDTLSLSEEDLGETRLTTEHLAALDEEMDCWIDANINLW
jgi:hypothetical protein